MKVTFINMFKCHLIKKGYETVELRKKYEDVRRDDFYDKTFW